MSEVTEKTIHYDSAEAARPHKKNGWASANGMFYGDEHTARWAGCTHVKCVDCGAWTSKTYTVCDECRRKKSIERYNAMPYEEWDGQKPLVVYDDDRYFFSEDDLLEYCENEEIEPADLMLVICKPNHYHYLESDYWADYAPEDWEPPKELQEAMNKLNAVIKELPPISYSAGKTRTSYKSAQ